MDKNRLREVLKGISSYIFWIIVFYIGLRLITGSGQGQITTKELVYSELIEVIESNNIKEITIYGSGEVSGKYIKPVENLDSFKSTLREQDEQDLTRRLLAAETKARIIKKPEVATGFDYLVTFMPWLFILFVIFLISRSVKKSAAGMNPFNFARTKGQSLTKSSIRFKDVAGVDEAIEELSEIVEFLRNPVKFTKLGGKIPKGVLLVGPPGVGKTLLAKAVAGEAEVPFFSMECSRFVEMFVGVGASRVRDLFAQAQRAAPSIIFLDEIDAFGKRGGGTSTGSDREHEQTLNQILVEMDGFEGSRGIIVIGATNRPEKLDEAMVRPGRFDRKVFVQPPDLKGREEILRIHSRFVVIDASFDFKKIAKMTAGFTGADLANLINKAALSAAKADKKSVGMKDFEDAKEKITMGSENRSLSSVMTEEDKRIIAYHEAGHAIVAMTLPEADPIYKVSIIPHGQALGITSQLPDKDRYNYSKEYLEELIAILFGGRVAEELTFGKITTGAKNDIKQATKVVAQMVCEFGMSSLGAVDYAVESSSIFDNGYQWSQSTRQKIDEEITKIIDTAYKKAKKIISEKKSDLKKIAEALLEKETLSREVIESLVKES